MKVVMLKPSNITSDNGLRIFFGKIDSRNVEINKNVAITVKYA